MPLVQRILLPPPTFHEFEEIKEDKNANDTSLNGEHFLHPNMIKDGSSHNQSISLNSKNISPRPF